MGIATTNVEVQINWYRFSSSQKIIKPKPYRGSEFHLTHLILVNRVEKKSNSC